MRESRLSDPGNVLDQEMAACDESHEREADDIALTSNDILDSLLEPVEFSGACNHRSLTF